jgi:hemerythrin-like domain-containing protein
MRVVAEVETILGQAPDRDGEWMGRLMAKLPTLSASMRAHFSAEEQGALFTELPLKKPRLEQRIRNLGTEHGKMVADLDRITEMARALRQPEIHELRELNAHIQLFIATIRRHEAEENEIIMSAYWDELGAAD